jgi:hypothetical protein
MRVLVIYRSEHTFTNAVYEHLMALKNLPRASVHYVALGSLSALKVRLDNFDCIVVHFSVRLPFDQLSFRTAERIAAFKGVKALFIQDDYDNPRRTQYWIKTCGFDIVFTVVPSPGLARIYPAVEFPKTEFVSVLTGYTSGLSSLGSGVLPSKRTSLIGYRGRSLPLQYGQLGREKVIIGQRVKEFCRANAIPCDIAWTDDERIYGADWYAFVSANRASLGSESGCNVFDWDNDIASRVEKFIKHNPNATEEDVYNKIIAPLEIPDLMNQISPRCFEAIELRTVLVLLEGNYSGVLTPEVHYIALKKDYSNMAEVFKKLSDGEYCDKMAERAYVDIIDSGIYSYQAFAEKIGDRLRVALELKGWHALAPYQNRSQITDLPRRSVNSRSLTEAIRGAENLHQMVKLLSYYFWGGVPAGIRVRVKPVLRQMLRID